MTLFPVLTLTRLVVVWRVGVLVFSSKLVTKVNFSFLHLTRKHHFFPAFSQNFSKKTQKNKKQSQN